MTVLHKNFIGGQSLSVETGDRIKVYNPARDIVLAEIPDTPADMVDRAVQAAKKAQKLGQATGDPAR
jgi:lactaldehyde dehydrogenase/glycolaldehyde dehydrogenase